MTTECHCGFKYDAFSDELSTERFIEVEGHFTITPEHGMTRRVRLFACPRCDTVRLDRWGHV